MNRRLCSVWQSEGGFYCYYAVPAGDVARPVRAPIRPPLGDTPENLLGVLPESALYVGAGPLARGEIVVDPRGAS